LKLLKSCGDRFERIEHNDSITFLDSVRDSVPGVKDTDLRVLPGQMQRQGYYASIQGPWLVCSKSKKQHDTLLFAAQAARYNLRSSPQRDIRSNRADEP
jgi:hypothetical protein